MAPSADRLIRGAQCVNTNFRNADFSDSRWSRGVFTACNFTGARTETGDFSDARVQDSSGVPARTGLPGASLHLKKEIPRQRRASRLRPSDRDAAGPAPEDGDRQDLEL